MKYEIIMTSAFKKELKNLKKRNKDLSKLTEIVNKLANDEKLDLKNLEVKFEKKSRPVRFSTSSTGTANVKIFSEDFSFGRMKPIAKSFPSSSFARSAL